MMQALARGVPLVRTGRGEAFYRRLRPSDAPSVSSGRFSEGGLAARLWVLEELAQTLARAGRLGPYRRPLDWALERVASDAGPEHPAAVAEAERLARRYAGYPWLRTWRRVRRRAAAEARRIRGAPPLPADAGPGAPDEEVRYGLPSAGPSAGA